MKSKDTSKQKEKVRSSESSSHLVRTLRDLSISCFAESLSVIDPDSVEKEAYGPCCDAIDGAPAVTQN